MQRIEVSRSTGDLTRKCWEFTILDFPKVYLEYYGEEERKTKRHKWRAPKKYTRQNPGRVYEGVIIREEPKVPADVVAEALAKFAEQLEFCVWKTRTRVVPGVVVETKPLECEVCGEYHTGDEWERWYAKGEPGTCPDRSGS